MQWSSISKIKGWDDSYKKLETLRNKIAKGMPYLNLNPKTIPPFWFNGEFRMGIYGKCCFILVRLVRFFKVLFQITMLVTKGVEQNLPQGLFVLTLRIQILRGSLF